MNTYTGPNPQVTLGDARNGATVVLDDGTTARLQWLRRDHGRAVIHDGQRHRRIDPARIVRVLKRGDQ